MKLMLDSSVIFALDNEHQDLLSDLLAVAEELDLLTTHVQADEDVLGSRAYHRLPFREVATTTFILGRSRLGAAKLGPGEAFELLREGKPRQAADALIMEAAMAEGATLVMRDRAALNRLQRSGLGLPVWGIEELKVHVRQLLEARPQF